jgi:site-specific DNA-methyltransferase (adenine-specific)
MKIDLVLGDCLEKMQDIPDESVDMILCDLPYGTTSIVWDSVIPMNNLWEEYARITKRGSPILLFGSGLFTASVILSRPKWYKYNLVWEKSKCGSPLLAKYRPMMKHEDIVVFSNGGGKHTQYNPQMLEGEPYKRDTTFTKINNHNLGIKQVKSENKGTRHPSSVLKFPMKWRRQDQMHPTQKPVELMEWLIKSYTNEEETILDNCMGSGTTGVACINTNRNFIGIEKDEKYFEIAKNRINNTLKEKLND